MMFTTGNPVVDLLLLGGLIFALVLALIVDSIYRKKKGLGPRSKDDWPF